MCCPVGCQGDMSADPAPAPAQSEPGLYLGDCVDPVVFKCCKHVDVVIFSFHGPW